LDRQCGNLLNHCSGEDEMIGLKQVHGVAADTTMKVGKVLHLQHNKDAGGW
jgi:hypothetical protein